MTPGKEALQHRRGRPATVQVNIDINQQTAVFVDKRQRTAGFVDKHQRIAPFHAKLALQ